jgi:hypothetical protein
MSEHWLGPRSVIGNRIEERKQIPEEPEGDLTRRQMLWATGLNAASAVAATSIVGKIAFDESKKTSAPESKKVEEIHIESPHSEHRAEHQDPEWWKKVWYVTPKELIGKNVDNNLEWSYIQPESEYTEPTPVQKEPLVKPTSLPKILPPIAFHKNLERMIEVKKGLTKHVPEAKEDAAFFDSLGESYADLFQKKEIRKMDLEGLRGLIEKESNTVLAELQKEQPRIVDVYLSKHLDGTGWEQGTPGREKYNEAMARCLQSLAEHITPEIMLAYITTELMPAPDRGIAMLEFLTKHAGVEFVERIPAISDSELSFGPFQLTPYVVGDKGSVTELLKVMHSDLLPNSLEEFSSIEDHMRAGLLFAFQNILALVQDACREGRYDEVITILEGANSGRTAENSSVFFEFISAAHHRPESAREAMNNWLSKNKSLPPAKRSKTLTTSFNNDKGDHQDRDYAAKAQQCLETIRRA